MNGAGKVSLIAGGGLAAGIAWFLAPSMWVVKVLRYGWPLFVMWYWWGADIGAWIRARPGDFPVFGAIAFAIALIGVGVVSYANGVVVGRDEMRAAMLHEKERLK